MPDRWPPGFVPRRCFESPKSAQLFARALDDALAPFGVAVHYVAGQLDGFASWWPTP